MRLFFGIVLGIAITLGAAFVHDSSMPPDPSMPPGVERQIVNWEVLADTLRGTVGAARDLWNRAFGR